MKDRYVIKAGSGGLWRKGWGKKGDTTGSHEGLRDISGIKTSKSQRRAFEKDCSQMERLRDSGVIEE